MTEVIVGDSDDFDQTEIPRTRADQIFESLGRRGPGAAKAGIAHKVAGYQIVPEPKLGEGRFSTVYRARDLTVPRDVAIKILREGAQPEEIQRERMENEALALAKLQGTAAGQHIVEIYSRSRSAQGPHFLVLELVEGRSLANRIQDRGPLPARAAATLVRTIAEVMSVAHQMGIVHRDLKPSNVLLADDDSPKITDFGLAHFADHHEGLTVDGEILGTIEYMPPEQAGAVHAEVDALSDVYSIGVILYECLTGSLPFRGPNPAETLLMIRSGREPIAPDQLVMSVPRDLSTICLKCLSQKKDARYAGAAELAADLGRFLDGHPIQARRAAAPERLAKLIRRNRGVSALIGLVIASVIVGVVATLLYAGRAIRQEARANQNADLRFRALENVLTAVTGEKLKRAGQRPLQIELIKDLLPQFDAVLQLEGDDPATRNLQGLAWINLSVIRRELGEMPQALEAARIAQGLFQKLIGLPRFAAEASIGLANALGHKGAILGMGGNYDEAITDLAEAARLLEPQALSEIPGHLYRLGHIHNNWANCLMRRDKARSSIEDASRHYRQAVDYFGRSAATLSTARDWQARTLSNLALIVEDPLGQHPEAIDLARQATDLAKGFLKDFPNDIDSQDCVASCVNNLGELQMGGGDTAGSLPLLREALTLYEQLATRVPENFDFRWSVAMARSNIGADLTAGPAAGWPEALQCLRRAQAEYEALVKEKGKSEELMRYFNSNRQRLDAIEAKQKSPQ